MFIIVKKINPGIKIENIVRFMAPAMKSPLFKKKGVIQSIKIIQLLDKNRRILERHGIIRITNKPTKKVVSHLKGRVKGGERQVDEYIIRMWTNDRRTNVAESVAYPNDRRKADRRRKGLTIVTVCEKPRMDAAGFTTVLERCEDTCSRCDWKTVLRHCAS